MIVAAGILLFFQGIAQVFRCIVCIRTGVWPKNLEDVEELEDRLIQESEEQVLRHGSEAVDVVQPETPPDPPEGEADEGGRA